MTQWLLVYLLGVVTTGASVPIVGWMFSELRQQRARIVAARLVVAQQLDPLLKAADELHGKLRSVAEEDFSDFRDLPPAERTTEQVVDLCSTLHLFTQFWARLEILRRKSFHSALATTKQGALLLSFLRSLESRRVRLVDRGWQRLIGESAVISVGDHFDTLTFRDFIEQYETGGSIRRWVRPLEEILLNTWRGQVRDRQRARQRVLQYGVVVHAFIDTLDPKHRTTRERPGYPNKLTRRMKRDLIGRVFGQYLPKVSRTNVQKYTGIHR